MYEFWVFHCPPGGDRAAAIRGDIICPMIQVWAEETVREAYPNAVHISRVGR